MLQYVKYLTNPFVLGAIGGIIMLVILYMDDRSNNNEIVYTDYLKLFITSGAVTTAMIFLSKMNLAGWLGGGSQMIKNIAPEPDYDGFDMQPDF